MTVKEHRKKVLEKLGFTKREGRKHEVWSYRTGKTHFSTSVSRNNRDIGKGLLRSICTQLHITKAQYWEIASCNMSKEDYNRHIFNIEIVP